MDPNPTKVDPRASRSRPQQRHRTRLVPWLVLLGTAGTTLAVIFAILSTRAGAGHGWIENPRA